MILRSDPTFYQYLIGALKYLAVTTRPDISHSVSKLGQCNINPKAEHEIGAKHGLRYLANSIDYKLGYYEVCGYVDADWGGDLNDRKSYSGYLFMVAGATLSWESKKQTIVALSTTQAEYVALSTAAKEAVYLKNLLT
ncbi:uncharacterized protein LOC129250099 [Anastrepha obliqua]|uniref:uncharacterized protein LOC129250099 n=1 Tax=Anastrepha obliqua TaxID=95512 RepID=UPI002409C86F|nr:uncharacterized protein LOC129250099 [Anastrepha obliqua]